MTKFEAETYKQFAGYNGEQITLKEWIAAQVNDSWIYSAHWKDESWVKQAKNDCLSRIDTVKKDLYSLYRALEKIEKIDAELADFGG
jgi:hypothetical protein